MALRSNTQPLDVTYIFVCFCTPSGPLSSKLECQADPGILTCSDTIAVRVSFSMTAEAASAGCAAHNALPKRKSVTQKRAVKATFFSLDAARPHASRREGA